MIACSLCNKEHNTEYKRCPLCREKHRLYMLKYTAENKECINKQSRERYVQNFDYKSRKVEQHKKYVAANKDKVYNQQHSWYEENKERILQERKEYYEKNKERIAPMLKEYAKANRNICNAALARNRVKRLRRIPVWLTEEHWTEINTLYKNKPKDYHVDHIVPLCGKEVSGLHVPWNLQYLPASENHRKSNKLL